MKVATRIRSILCITALIVMSSSFVYSKASKWDEDRAKTALIVSMSAFSDTMELYTWKCRWCVSRYLKNMTLVAPIFSNIGGVKGVVMHDDTTIYIAFSGTKSAGDWFKNIDVARINYPLDPKSSVHRGFYLAMVDCRSEVKRAALWAVKKCPTCTKVIFTGHSMGGAITMLSALDMSEELKRKGLTISAITFGQPRVGNYAFTKYVQRNLPDFHRVVHKLDIIPHILSPVLGYRHVPNEIWQKSKNEYVQCSDDDREDNSCSGQYAFNKYNFHDHNSYMGLGIVW